MAKQELFIDGPLMLHVEESSAEELADAWARMDAYVKVAINQRQKVVKTMLTDLPTSTPTTLAKPAEIMMEVELLSQADRIIPLSAAADLKCWYQMVENGPRPLRWLGAEIKCYRTYNGLWKFP